MTKKEIAIVACVVILTFGIGAFAGFKIGSVGPKFKSNPAAPNENDSFQAGWDAAKKKLEESRPALSGTAEIKTLSGQVEKVDGSNITLKINNALDPLADPNLGTRIVATDSNTKFFQQTQKDQATYQKEMEDFNKKMQEQKSAGKTAAAPPTNPEQPLTPPQPFEKKEISLADIKADQQVTVTSADNIKDAKQFKATEITVQFTPTASAANAPASLATPPAGVTTGSSAILPPPSIPTSGNNTALPAPPALPKI